jgi:hypothetical protein
MVRSWYYFGICAERLRNTKKSISLFGRYPRRDSDRARPKYKPKALPLDELFRRSSSQCKIRELLKQMLKT